MDTPTDHDRRTEDDLAARGAYLTDDEASLAAIVGDLWDYPPESPSPEQYRVHLADRYGDDVAAVWDRLGEHPADDRWSLSTVADRGAGGKGWALPDEVVRWLTEHDPVEDELPVTITGADDVFVLEVPLGVLRLWAELAAAAPGRPS